MDNNKIIMQQQRNIPSINQRQNADKLSEYHFVLNISKEKFHVKNKNKKKQKKPQNRQQTKLFVFC